MVRRRHTDAQLFAMFALVVSAARGYSGATRVGMHVAEHVPTFPHDAPAMFAALSGARDSESVVEQRETRAARIKKQTRCTIRSASFRSVAMQSRAAAVMEVVEEWAPCIEERFSK